jgi:hypothetical protein
MIKLEDRVSVVILCLITFMGTFYALMMVNANFASAFLESLGRPTPKQCVFFWSWSSKRF